MPGTTTKNHAGPESYEQIEDGATARIRHMPPATNRYNENT